MDSINKRNRRRADVAADVRGISARSDNFAGQGSRGGLAIRACDRDDGRGLPVKAPCRLGGTEEREQCESQNVSVVHEPCPRLSAADAGSMATPVPCNVGAI